jgi:hypothetical protein
MELKGESCDLISVFSESFECLLKYELISLCLFNFDGDFGDLGDFL